MKTAANYFFRDMGVLFGRSMRHILRNRGAMSVVTIMPIALMLLFAYVLGGAILIFLTIGRKL